MFLDPNMKRLDQKIANILRDPTGAKGFIIADAKDADMAFGITAPGPAAGSCRHGCGSAPSAACSPVDTG